MTENEYCNIQKWLLFTEAFYHNRLIDIQNNFFSQRYHDINDCVRLLLAEQRLKDFNKFSADLNLILRLGY